MMKNTVLVTHSELTDAQRSLLQTTAEANGARIIFASTGTVPESVAADSTILFGQEWELLHSMPALRWLCLPTAGVDRYLGPDSPLRPGTLLSNSTGAYGVTLAEHSVMALLEVMRRAPEYAAAVSRKQWTKGLAQKCIFGSRIGLLGTGDIGTALAERLRAFGPHSVIGINRSGRNPGNCFDKVCSSQQLPEILPEIDALILSLPSTPETFHILNAEMLALLPDGAIVVNVGRGSLIDTPALLAELVSGRLSAALDVFEQEPLPQDSPLWDCPNLLITPHVAGNRTLPYTAQRVAELFAEDLTRYCHGEMPKRLISRERGY